MKLGERLWSLHTFLKKAANQPALHSFCSCFFFDERENFLFCEI